MPETPDSGLLLPGLDGSNPLGFLAALGLLRLVSRSEYKPVRLSWKFSGGSYVPMLYIRSLSSVNDLINLLMERVATEKSLADHCGHLDIAPNLSIEPSKFRKLEERSLDFANSNTRLGVDLVASYGNSSIKYKTYKKLWRIVATDFHFTFGSGHQNYLKTVRKLHDVVNSDHIHETIIGPWKRKDVKSSLRWDPVDAKEHAYQWTAPGDETATTVWGANLLAYYGTSMFPTVPTSHGLLVTGFSGKGKQRKLRWPIWSGALDEDVISSLIAQTWGADSKICFAQLRAVGISEIYECRKLRLGDPPNYKWAFSPARSALQS